MIFKKMKHMDDLEIQRCLSILIENGIILSTQKNDISNSITVVYEVLGDTRKKEFSLDLLPDSISNIEFRDQLRPDGEYLYHQYTIAKGYSEFWKGNMFIE